MFTFKLKVDAAFYPPFSGLQFRHSSSSADSFACNDALCGRESNAQLSARASSWCGSVCVQAWLMVALRACTRGSARLPAQLCMRACLALCALRRSSARAGTCALLPMHIAKGPRPHVPPADHIVCPPPLLVPPLLSLSLSSTPFSPLLFSVRCADAVTSCALQGH
jgi:hypothetical protein